MMPFANCEFWSTTAASRSVASGNDEANNLTTSCRGSNDVGRDSIMKNRASSDAEKNWLRKEFAAVVR